MDYKHIEQLLERYWQCETSVEEENQLRFFFTQKELPAHLLPYKELFVYQQAQQQVELSEDFDRRILARIEVPTVNVKRITLVSRLVPLFKAAAMVSIILVLGSVIRQSFYTDNALDYNYEAYTDTYDDPETAYKQVSSALMMLSEGINKSKDQLLTDSLKLNVEVE